MECEQSKAYPTMYVLNKQSISEILLVYVDHIVFLSLQKGEILCVAKHFQKHFEIWLFDKN